MVFWFVTQCGNVRPTSGGGIKDT